ncbi:MAG: chemotaxis protein CheB [Opitutales bacterium]
MKTSDSSSTDSGHSASGNSRAHPVVGIGFSAGGLEAFKDFLGGIDPATRASYVIIQHLATDYRSQLLEIIESNAPLKVQHLTDRHSIKPATIYLLKQDSEVRIEDDHFVLSRPANKTVRRSSIDLFFASLAQAKAEQAVGVVLSGSGTDGTVGLQKIKAKGGMCLAQTPADAEFSGMPKSAIASGCVDFVGSAGDLARKADASVKHCKASSRPTGRSMEETSRALSMDHFDAVSAIVDRHMNVRYLGGKTERYLRQPEGAPTQDLRNMVGASVGLKLRQFGKLALEEQNSQSFETSLGGSEGGRVRVTLKPIRLEHSEDGLFILFEAITDSPKAGADAAGTPSGDAANHPEQNLLNGLDRDLKEARDELAETVAALETSNEDLKTSNEEVMSMNEELQSSNEELETSKEELQSLNEELNTVNKQLSSKVDELERSHNDVHNLLTSTNIATIFLDEKLRIKRFTSATSRLFNLIESDIGRPISDLTGKFDGDDLIATCRLVLDDLKSREETVEGLDHAHYLRRILPYRTQDNRIEGIVITFDDITQLRKTQEELIRAERYLRLAIQNSSIIVFAQDLELKYTYILNQPPEYRREDIIGKTDKEVLFDNYAQVDAIKREVLRTGQSKRVTLKISTKQQRIIWLDVMLECLRDAEGDITGLCGASIDITEQVDREAELEQAKEGAEAADRAKTRFLSSMSHDIRTPLTSIMSLAEILDELLDPDYQEIAGEIQHACNHLLKTLNSVLDLARLQAEELELTLEPVDLNEILEEIRCVFDPKRKRVDEQERLRLTVEDPSILVQAERGALLRVFGNLVGNALKFCPDAAIEIRAAMESKMARIEVADQGPGISPEFQKDLFKPFSQEQGKQKSSLPGSGLGLSITRELVDLMQGTIEVDSKEGQGTTMIVRLPLS